MKWLFFSIFLPLFITTNSFAQSKQICGCVIDNTTKKNLKDASILLLNKKDSFIVAETRSNQDGKFRFDIATDHSNYILFISYPEYISYSTNVDLKLTSNETINLKEITLKSHAGLLQEVTVKAKFNNVRMKGDTVEYFAERFKLPTNCTVDELLKVLPGLHLNNKGEITAQGKRVRQVFVDGEEFFSDDPRLVTKNLRANMVGTVQVYDKKSPAATFTGINDGIKDRVINLKLKENKNNGIFGKIELGAGPGAENKVNYSSQAMLNSFKQKRKASAYFSSNNIGQMGLGSSDKDKLGIGFTPEKYDGKGLPDATAWGLHYNNKWNRDKSSINGDYNFSFTRVSGYETVFSQNNLPTGVINRNSLAADDRKTWMHKANVHYKQSIDSNTNITLYAAGAYGRNSLGRSYTGSDKDESANLLNETSERINEDYDFRSYTFNFLLQKKLKPRRTISVAWENLLNSKDGQQTFLSSTRYYNGLPTEDSTKKLDLIKKLGGNSRKIVLNVGYTELIGKNYSLLANYNATQDFTDDDNRSFPLLSGPMGEYDRAFSTVRTNDKWAHTGNVQFNYSQKKERISVGGTAGVANLAMNDKMKTQLFTRQYQIWKPMFRFQHNLNNNTNFTITYRGNTVIPDFQQLLPYAFNNTQLVTYRDNTYLSSGFSNNFGGTYESFRNLSKAFTAINVNHTVVSNPIVLSMDISKSGNYILQYVNLPGYANSNFEITGFYSRPINKPKMQLTLDGNIRGGNSFNLLNGALNKLNYEIYSFGLFGSRNKANKYDIYLGATASYNSNAVTAGKEEVTYNNFFSFSIKPSFDLYFLKKFQLHSDADYLWQDKSEVFKETFDRLIWNAWIGGNFLKTKELTIKLACNDILNANTGISRIAAGSFFTESKFVTIKRFFMMSVTWNFTKFKMIK